MKTKRQSNKRKSRKRGGVRTMIAPIVTNVNKLYSASIGSRFVANSRTFESPQKPIVYPSVPLNRMVQPPIHFHGTNTEFVTTVAKNATTIYNFFRGTSLAIRTVGTLGKNTSVSTFREISSPECDKMERDPDCLNNFNLALIAFLSPILNAALGDLERRGSKSIIEEVILPSFLPENTVLTILQTYSQNEHLSRIATKTYLLIDTLGPNFVVQVTALNHEFNQFKRTWRRDKKYDEEKDEEDQIPEEWNRLFVTKNREISEQFSKLFQDLEPSIEAYKADISETLKDCLYAKVVGMPAGAVRFLTRGINDAMTNLLVKNIRFTNEQINMNLIVDRERTDRFVKTIPEPTEDITKDPLRRVGRLLLKGILNITEELDRGTAFSSIDKARCFLKGMDIQLHHIHKLICSEDTLFCKDEIHKWIKNLTYSLNTEDELQQYLLEFVMTFGKLFLLEQGTHRRKQLEQYVQQSFDESMEPIFERIQELATDLQKEVADCLNGSEVHYDPTNDLHNYSIIATLMQ